MNVLSRFAKKKIKFTYDNIVVMNLLLGYHHDDKKRI